MTGKQLKNSLIVYYGENVEKINKCRLGSNNSDENDNSTYFWVKYQDEEDDNILRKMILKFADELPAEKALEVFNNGAIATYRAANDRYIQERKECLERKCGASYEKALRKGKISNDTSLEDYFLQNVFNQLERGKNGVKRTRKLTLEQMIAELEKRTNLTTSIDLPFNIVKNNDYEGIPSNIIKRLEAEHVIKILNDIQLTLQQAKDVATAWNMLKIIDKKDITDDNITPDQVKGLFIELYDSPEMNDQVAKLVADVFNKRQINLCNTSRDER